jgi:single-strand DNA-binding protein
MSNINKIILSGYIGVNPELKATQNGKRITRFTIGCKSQWGDNAPTDWFKIVAFDKTAEYMQRYAKKGDYAIVVGTLKKNEWVDSKTNIAHKDYEIWANDIELKSKNNNTTQLTQTQSSDNNPFKDAGINVQEVDTFNDDDIPF